MFFDLPDTAEEEKQKVVWFPQEGPQSEAISATWCPELLYGGARGGGKSDFLLGDWLQDVNRYKEAWQGIVFRKTLDDLKHLIKRSYQLYSKTGAIWRVTDKEWHWPNGARLRMSYLDNPVDADRYQGHEFVWIAFDEIGQWATEEGYQKLFACLRTSYHVPTKRIRATANPGGPGHHWVKERFIDLNPKGFEPFTDPETDITRMFIPSSVTDNKILLSQDPQYVNRLKAVGSPELVKAWLEGDWNIIKGAYFPEFSNAEHVISPVKLPAHWMRFRAFDWGSASPFACVWFAVSDGSLPGIQKNALVIYREWYGARKANKGLNMKNELIAKGIRSRESKGEIINYSVADPAMFKSEGGPSLAEVYYKGGVNFRKADNARIVGWSNLRSRLLGNSEGSLIFFFSTCKHTIRTLPALQHDQKKPEDVDTTGDDHLADAIRYGCMSRPVTKGKKQLEKTKTLADLSLNQLWKAEQELERRSGF